MWVAMIPERLILRKSLTQGRATRISHLKKNRISHLKWKDAKKLKIPYKKWIWARKISKALKTKIKKYTIHIKINYKKVKGHSNFYFEGKYFVNARNKKEAKKEALRKACKDLDLDIDKLFPKKVFKYDIIRKHIGKIEYAKIRYHKKDRWKEYMNGKVVK